MGQGILLSSLVMAFFYLDQGYVWLMMICTLHKGSQG